jgi:predicted nucleic acid-binding protein
VRILIDCNVLLDVMARREPHYGYSARVLDACERGIHGAVAWHTLATAAYLSADQQAARDFFRALLRFIAVPGTDTNSAQLAVDLPFEDFEDALQSASAQKFQADFVVTRNVEDFKHSPVPAMTPEDFCAAENL